MEEEQKDIDLLTKALTRLALSNDSQLEEQLNLLLIPVLAKFNSPHETVRKKVKIIEKSLYQQILEILSHINKRVKPNPSVSLPLKDLTEFFVDPSTPPSVLPVIMLYLEMAYTRASEVVRIPEIPRLMNVAVKLNLQQRDIIYHLVLHVILTIFKLKNRT
jgi:proteasome component ECM29